MSKQVSRPMADLTSAVANAGVNCGDFNESDMYVFGTFVATIQVEASTDNVNWVPVGSTITGAGVVPLPVGAKFARTHVTAFTSGTVSSSIGGRSDNFKA